MHEKILTSAEFSKIGELNYQLSFQLWWKPNNLIQVSIIDLDPYYLLWGQMTYQLESIGESGETFVRDIPGLFNYLEAHFPALNIVFNFYRDSIQEMILKRIKDRGMRDWKYETNLSEKEARLESIKNRFDTAKSELYRIEDNIHLAGENDPLLNRLHSNLQRKIKHEMEICLGSARNGIFQFKNKLLPMLFNRPRSREAHQVYPTALCFARLVSCIEPPRLIPRSSE